MKNKRCQYRNCDNIIISGRVDKKYCCDQCKNCEKVYRKRERHKNKLS